ncbi:MAG: ATP-binding cassette domain-containing protein [Crocinitomicaceae bacterium]|nr:ATP-binding cassette domain-containing protein [Crocinitomicaceae bacterium]
MENEVVIHLEHAQIQQNENVVLRDVNLKVHSGEFIYLIGRTGTGKSSLLKTLYGALPLRKGKGLCCGYELHNIRERQIPYLRRKIGIVFQSFELLTDRTVKDNLLFVLKATGWTDQKAMDSRIQSVLDLVSLEDKSYKMPHELSGGEQQRVAIARSLLNTPHLIIADEPTGNLDPATSLEILNLLLAISRSGTSVLMASHDYATMQKFSSRIIVCENGELRESSDISTIVSEST